MNEINICSGSSFDFFLIDSPVSMASASLDFHFSATSFARGSSGLGALSKAWIDSRTVRICRAGDHLSENVRTVKQTNLIHLT